MSRCIDPDASFHTPHTPIQYLPFHAVKYSAALVWLGTAEANSRVYGPNQDPLINKAVLSTIYAKNLYVNCL